MRQPTLEVRFFETDTGNEPVRERLRGLSATDKKTIGEDVKTVQFGWPLGIPLVAHLDGARARTGSTVVAYIAGSFVLDRAQDDSDRYLNLDRWQMSIETDARYSGMILGTAAWLSELWRARF